jgi:hypothetical protein
VSIDKYRVNAWSAKKAIDAHLDGYRKQAKPSINVDAIVFWMVVVVCTSVFFYLRGYRDCEDDQAKPRAETSSLQTKCTSYDVRNGQKYCLTWRLT